MNAPHTNGPGERGERRDRPCTERYAPLVDVVVLSWRNATTSCRTLSALAEHGPASMRVIVVDNSSADGTGEVVWQHLRRLWPDARQASHRGTLLDDEEITALADRLGPSPASGPRDQPEAMLVRLGRNRGYSGGMNAGLRVARRLGAGEFFFLLADDIMITEGCIEELIARCGEDDRIGLCGPTQHVFDESGTLVRNLPAAYRHSPLLGWAVPVPQWRNRPAGAPVTASERRRVERWMHGVHGNAVFGTGWFLETVGLLSTERFLYFEEPEWGIRARKAGFKVAWAPKAVVHNQNDKTVQIPTAGRQERLALVHYMMARGGVLFTRRYYPQYLPTVIAARLARSVEDCVRKGPRVGWMSVLGVVDALRGRHRWMPLLGDAVLPGKPAGRSWPWPAQDDLPPELQDLPESSGEAAAIGDPPGEVTTDGGSNSPAGVGDVSEGVSLH